jgi:hypothetical protein
MEVKTPRAMTSRSIFANQISTWFSLAAILAGQYSHKNGVYSLGSGDCRLF